MRLRQRQLEKVMRCIDQLYELRNPDSFPQEMLRLLSSVISCDNHGFNEFNRHGITRAIHSPVLPKQAFDYLRELGIRFYKDHPGLNYITQTRTPEPVRLTDHISLARWRRSALYNECFHVMGCNYQVGFLSQGANSRVGIAINRTSRDFSSEEKEMLALLRPHIVRAHAMVEAFGRLTGAMAALESAVVITDSSGRVEYATERAQFYLDRYFQGSTGKRLPAKLLASVKRATDPEETMTYSNSTDSGYLEVCLTPVPGRGLTLVLRERRPAKSGMLRSLGLTTSEAEVLFWMSQAKTNSEIATHPEQKQRNGAETRRTHSVQAEGRESCGRRGSCPRYSSIG